MTGSLGRFAWHDLLTPDVDASIAYYTAVLGWTVMPFGDNENPYQMWVTPGGKPVGGVMRLTDEAKAAGAPPHWFAHVTTPDLEASLAKAVSLGGTNVFPPTVIPTVGAFAVVADSAGAVFSLFQPDGEAPGHDDKPAVGEFGWHELMHTDPDAAWDYYEALFGWVKRGSMDMGSMGTYQMFGLPHTDSHFGAVMRTPAEGPPSSWLHYTRVADIHAAIKLAKDHGGTLMMGPHEVPGDDIIAVFTDPQGAAFAIYGSKTGA